MIRRITLILFSISLIDILDFSAKIKETSMLYSGIDLL